MELSTFALLMAATDLLVFRIPMPRRKCPKIPFRTANTC